MSESHSDPRHPDPTGRGPVPSASLPSGDSNLFIVLHTAAQVSDQEARLFSAVFANPAELAELVRAVHALAATTLC